MQEGKMTILIVEDDDMIIMLFERLLRHIKFDGNVVYTDTVFKTWEVLEEMSNIHLVLFDNRIRDGEVVGSGLIQFTREKFPSATLIATSGLELEEQMNEGCTMALPKPFNAKEVMSIMKKVLDIK